MPVYNGENYLSEAILSILNQTFSAFEYLIIDDGSTDNTWEILNSFFDHRIRIEKNKQNIGITKTLNRGLQLARGNYIARMDADDIFFPERLQRQKTFLDENVNIAMVGSWIEKIDKAGRKIETITFPIDPYLLSWRLLHTNTFVHSAVMFRKDAVLCIGGYSENYKYAEDYDLWSRLSTRWEIANLPIVLVKWRSWKGGLSTTHAKSQEKAAIQIAKRNMAYVLGEYPIESAFECLKYLYGPKSAKELGTEDIDRLHQNVEKLLDRFCHKFDHKNEAIPKAIRVEIATHVFSYIFSIPCSKIEKMRLVLYWVKIFKPNLLRIFSTFFFKRTLIGTRIYRVFS